MINSKIISILFLIFVIISCKNKKQEITDKIINDIDSLDQTNIEIPEINGVEKNLTKIITSYIEKYPINEKMFKGGYSKESYYVGFLKSKKDTLLGVTKQPFLYDKIFPEYIFRQNSNPTDFSKISEIPHFIGQFTYKDNSIMIFDTNQNVGKEFYEKSRMDTINSFEDYNYKTPIEGDIWHPKRFEVWKYRIVNSKILEVD